MKKTYKTGLLLLAAAVGLAACGKTEEAQSAKADMARSTSRVTSSIGMAPIAMAMLAAASPCKAESHWRSFITEIFSMVARR